MCDRRHGIGQINEQWDTVSYKRDDYDLTTTAEGGNEGEDDKKRKTYTGFMIDMFKFVVR